ncbi:hypothetical protein [Pectinatus cerevisiiphilus]|uniref:Uncharacterized protein n=1 Tax=Pectinatus cerevisiiphilus TaxID=86956 RepID=A0A4R3K755_9FIRM|nr:hypothetical protein [Pectinatus cerevisiiphilus]TCS78675.1 hypothetical protein EDC37_10928 [Pectinatus cerevisiiphilus]
MKKTLLFLFFLLLFMPLTTHAEIRQTENGTVTARESAFTYLQPVSANDTQPPAENNNTANKKNSSTVKPENLFTVYVKTTRFYDRHKNHFRELDELSLTSHNQGTDLLFDKDLPPKIEYTKDGITQTLPLKKISYNNQYFISFKIKHDSLTPLYTADKVEIVFPVITNGSHIRHVKDKKTGKEKTFYSKQSLKEDSTVIEKRYTLPPEIINEWQQVLTADLAPGTIKDTLS